jgi:hypothetical protein
VLCVQSLPSRALLCVVSAELNAVRSL